MIESGAASCRDGELLSILVGSGVPGRSAEAIGNEIIERFGTLGSIMGKSLEEIAAIRGIGPVKAIRIAAAYELTRRVVREMENNA